MLKVTSSVLQALRREAATAFPDECCGILLGNENCLEAIVPARNIHPKPQTRFEIDPQGLVDAHRAARSGGPQVVGYYHSHPAGSAQPSATDREMANGDATVWAIIAGDDITFWRDDESGFVALSYQMLGG